MYILIGVIIVLLALHNIKGNGYINWVYYWFLVNGVVIHIFLDGMIGLLKLDTWLSNQYAILDNRYAINEPTVRIISIIELLFMGPMCIWIAIKIKLNQLTATEQLIRIVSLVQLAGTIIFVYNEYSRDFIDVCVDGCYTFTPSNIFYFWVFFVMANPVWIIIPSYLAYNGLPVKNIKSQ